MKIIDDLGAGACSWRRIAPAVACAVIPAGACEFRHVWLDQEPTVARLVRARIHYHGRAAFSRAIHVECSSANVHGSADLRESVMVAPFAGFLIKETRRQKKKRSD